MYVSEEINFNQREDLESDNIECIWIKVIVQTGKTLTHRCTQIQILKMNFQICFLL